MMGLFQGVAWLNCDQGFGYIGYTSNELYE